MNGMDTTYGSRCEVPVVPVRQTIAAEATLPKTRLTIAQIFQMAVEAGFEPYEDYSLSGDSEEDELLQVGEYPVGESVIAFANMVQDWAEKNGRRG